MTQNEPPNAKGGPSVSQLGLFSKAGNPRGKKLRRFPFEGHPFPEGVPFCTRARPLDKLLEPPSCFQSAAPGSHKEAPWKSTVFSTGRRIPRICGVDFATVNMGSYPDDGDMPGPFAAVSALRNSGRSSRLLKPGSFRTSPFKNISFSLIVRKKDCVITTEN